jgi:hypothetical protein
MKRNIYLISFIVLVSLLIGCEQQFEEPVPLTQEEIHGIRMDDTQANNSLSNRDIERLRIMTSQLVNAIFNVGDDHVIRGLDALLTGELHRESIISSFNIARVKSKLFEHKVVEIRMDSSNRGALLVVCHVEYESLRINAGEYIIIANIIFSMTAEGFIAEHFEIIGTIEYAGDTVFVWDEAMRTHKFVNIADAERYVEVNVYG